MDCNHDGLTVESTNTIRCSKCNSHWQNTQALHLLIHKIEFLDHRLDCVENQLIDQINNALGELGLEPCESCGSYLRDNHFVMHGALNPKRIPCNFGTTGIHFRVDGDRILCSQCLLEKLNTQDSRLEPEHLHAVARWIVRHCGDVRLPEVLKKVPHPHKRIAELTRSCVNTVMVDQIRRV